MTINFTPTTNPKKRRDRCLIGRTLALLLFLMAIVSTTTAPTGRNVGIDTGTVNAPPMLRMWNWPDTAFLLGTYLGGTNLITPTGTATELWDFIESLGVDVMIAGYYYGGSNDSLKALQFYDTLSWSADVAGGQRLVRTELKHIGRDIGDARALEFYLFDSAQSPWYPFRFKSLNDTIYGQLAVNANGFPGDTLTLSEQVYKTSNTTPGTTIAQHVAFDQWDDDTNRIYRFRSQSADPGKDSAHDASRWIYERNTACDSLFYVVVTGHLFPFGTSADTASLLKVEVVYEVPQGEQYYVQDTAVVSNDTVVTTIFDVALVDYTIPVKTFYVTKNDLYPIDITNPIWDQYREVVFPFSLDYFTVNGYGILGPTHDTGKNGASQRIDIKVTWLGGEDLALRSVSLRDVWGQMVLGKGTTEQAWRQERIDFMRRLLYGANGSGGPNTSPDSIRRAHLGLLAGEEQEPTQYAGYAWMIEMLRDTFQVARPGAPGVIDSVGSFGPQYFQNDQFHQHWLSTAKFVGIESYLWTLPLRWSDSAYIRNGYNLRYEEIPSIREENGGRFHIGEIDLDDPTSVEEYTKTFQRAHVGRYMPYWSHLDDDFPGERWGLLHHLGDGARVSRATGRRLIQVPSLNGAFDFQVHKVDENTWRLDTLIGHFPTESELRAVTNIGLAYGAKGAVYWGLGGHQNFARDTADNGLPGSSIFVNNVRIRGGHGGGSWGQMEPTGGEAKTGDTTTNVTNFAVLDRDLDTAYTIPDLYVGYGTRNRAMKRVNARLREIGDYMMDLTWRESYSVHYATQWPWQSGMFDFKSRPIKSTEPVTAVRAWNPRTGVIDDPYRTFVEIGFFDTKTGATPVQDTNYIFVTNRRTFERPEWIDATTDRGKQMDSLAESRTIELTFNLPNPANTEQYNDFIHIREVLPPMDTIPLMGPRQPLDTTILSSGSASKALVTLRPGAGTLLMVTYTSPDASAILGSLPHNNQRKLLYEPGSFRYYATYYIYDSVANDSYVYLRRSYPMVDSSGPIIWEPMQHQISKKTNQLDHARIENYHPSLTYRRISDSAVIVSVVWTAHPWSTQHSTANEREVLLREVLFEDYFDSAGAPVTSFTWMPTKQTVGYHKGLNPDQWGTAVISSASADSGIGEYIAWSDSTVGIIARGLLLDKTISPSLSWTPYDTLNEYYSDLNWSPGQYPSMPPFTHRASKQDNTPIVWQQPGAFGYIGIPYQRLGYLPVSAGGPKLIQSIPLINSDPFWLTSEAGGVQYLQPSIDMTQDALGRIREGVTWERIYVPSGASNIINELFFQAVRFDTGVNQAHPMGGFLSHIDNNMLSATHPLYAVVSSQNQIMTLADTNKIPLFSVIYERTHQIGNEAMGLLEAKWLNGQTAQWVQQGAPPWKPLQLAHTGIRPNGAASVDNLEERYAVIYAKTTDRYLRTSREYFARIRPRGYMADGREISMRLNDSLGLDFTARLYDVWMSDANKSLPLKLVPFANPDSLSHMLPLLQSECFTTSDSLELGWVIGANLYALDTNDLNGRRLDCIVELVDSLSGDVVSVLDSTRLEMAGRNYYQVDNKVLDLLSGTYYVRARLSSPEFATNLPLDNTQTWHIGRVNSWIEEIAAKQVRKLDGEVGNGMRITIQPNPLSKAGEIRFSISHDEHVTLKLYDAAGHEVAALLEKEFYEAGRYAVEFSGTTLAPGVYVVELRTYNGRITEKVVKK